jgi:hypothetical protein
MNWIQRIGATMFYIKLQNYSLEESLACVYTSVVAATKKARTNSPKRALTGPLSSHMNLGLVYFSAVGLRPPKLSGTASPPVNWSQFPQFKRN